MEGLIRKYVSSNPVFSSPTYIARHLQLPHGVARLFDAQPEAFVKATAPICELFGFKVLPFHLHIILGGAVFYQAIFLISPVLSRPFKAYTSLNMRSKINWDLHVVSMVQSVLICWLAYLALGDPELLADRVFGYSRYGGNVSALACGYFLWDSYVSIKYVKFFGMGFALHGVTSLAVFLFGFVPSLCCE